MKSFFLVAILSSLSLKLGSEEKYKSIVNHMLFQKYIDMLDISHFRSTQVYFNEVLDNSQLQPKDIQLVLEVLHPQIAKFCDNVQSIGDMQYQLNIVNLIYNSAFLQAIKAGSLHSIGDYKKASYYYLEAVIVLDFILSNTKAKLYETDEQIALLLRAQLKTAYIDCYKMLAK